MRIQNETYLLGIIERFKTHKLAMSGLIIVLFEIICVVFLPVIMGLDPYTTDYSAFNSAPSIKHILGTDAIGRDLFSRLIFGGRISLLVGFSSTIISLIIGVTLGLFAGYYRKLFEIIVMRSADVFMAFPAIILILVLVAVFGPSVTTVIAVIGVLGWPKFARLIYANVLVTKGKDYVESARAIGTNDLFIVLKYILPNSFAPILIALTFSSANAIILEASLSFLGMGVQPPVASWGNLMYNAQSIVIISTQPWVWLPPGLMLVITVLSINFLGDGLRDALDPKMKVN